MRSTPAGPLIARLTACTLFTLAIASAAHAQTPVFEDDFNQPALDTSKWMVESFAGKNQGNFRAEAVFYKPEAVSVSNHALHITVERIPTQDEKTGNVLPLRTGRIQSHQSFLYGRFEFRARLPRGAGLWPAIWMRTPYGQPFNGELDVLEGHGSQPNLIQSTLHPWVNGVEPRQYCAWLLVQPQPDNAAYHGTACQRVDNKLHLSSDLASSYHVYTLDWAPGKATWSLDGQPYFEVTEKVPSIPMTIVMNVSFSHNWDGGSPDKVALPQSLDVSYVKVYPYKQ